jgi:hypothetical protein
MQICRERNVPATQESFWKILKALPLNAQAAKQLNEDRKLVAKAGGVVAPPDAFRPPSTKKGDP